MRLANSKCHVCEPVFLVDILLRESEAAAFTTAKTDCILDKLQFKGFCLIAESFVF
jgi:hypothetical protein